MGIMTPGATHDHPFSPPAAQPLPMGATRPILRLLEMALGTELVRLVHVNRRPLGHMQIIQVFRIMTGPAIHDLRSRVFQRDIGVHGTQFRRGILFGREQGLVVTGMAGKLKKARRSLLYKK